MSDALRTLIEDGNVHVMDGAMGTVLYNRGVFVNVCYDELNLKDPDIVRDVHRDYVRAGAELIETNTFGANPVKLSAFGLETETERINHSAAEIAKIAAQHRAYVLGAIGPLGIRIEPFGPTSRDEAVALFARQAEGLAEGNVDGFILETFSDIEEMLAAINAVRGVSQSPIFAQMTVGEDGNTTYGTAVETVARTLSDRGADVVGLNCSVGPAAMLEGVERMMSATELPVSAQPNAGLPRDVGDRKIYLAGPEYVARYARRMVDAGTKFIGGCCGTTPEHIKKIVELVSSLRPRRSAVYVSRHEITDSADVHPVRLADRSDWGRKLSSGEFVTSVELLPPKGWRLDALLSQARELRDGAVDAVNLLDGPRSQSRMGVLPSAIIVRRDVGIEPIVHYTCRDRNMLGMISDLLGAAAADVRNLLLITGDPPRMGPYDSTGVFDIDSIGLTNVVYHLNHGHDPGGNPIGEPTPFVIGVAVNPGAVDLNHELNRFHWKVDAGADYAVTQPVFDVPQFLAFAERVEGYRIPIVAGLWPLMSLRRAEFLANEVPGVTVPEYVLDRMQKAQERGADAARAEGVAIAREVLSGIRSAIAGVHINNPSGNTGPALEVLASLD